jgi:hypothetical protein
MRGGTPRGYIKPPAGTINPAGGFMFLYTLNRTSWNQILFMYGNRKHPFSKAFLRRVDRITLK